MPDFNWQQIGLDLRGSALDAHDGELPPVDSAYGFLLDNPECFGVNEWPPDMPATPNVELIIGYYNAYLEAPNA